MPQYKCPRCHKLFEWPSDACPHCGMRITMAVDKAKPLYCSECGAELYEGKSFCPSCGSNQSTKQEVKHVEIVEVSPANEKGGYASFILGLISIYITWFCLSFFLPFGFMAFTSLILGLIATIMGAIKCRRSSRAKTGMIFGIISMAVSTLVLLGYAAMVVAIVMFLTRVLQ